MEGLTDQDLYISQLQVMNELMMQLVEADTNGGFEGMIPKQQFQVRVLSDFTNIVSAYDSFEYT